MNAFTRRNWIQLTSTGLAGCAVSGASTTPAQAKQCGRTAPNIEGPFYKSGAPTINDLRQDQRGDRSKANRDMQLVGYVRDSKCRPIEGALVDVWHADHSGAYDNEGVLFRGKQITDANGRYSLMTIIPGRYKVGKSYRPAHMHFKVSAAGHRTLTTQLYFSDDLYNEADRFYDASLVMGERVFNGCSQPPPYKQYTYNFGL